MQKVFKTYRVNRRYMAWALGGILLPLFLLLWLDHNLKPVILTMAEARARVMAVQAMNNAVYEVMQEGGLYQDLMAVSLDAGGRVSMMQANSARMNELATQAALLVQRNLEMIGEEGIQIPIGAALGIRILSGSGPSIRVKVVPAGTVSTEFKSEFSSAGINQTRHRIYLEMHASVQMVIPTGSKTAQVTGHVPVAESIIVGDVPDAFVELSGGSMVDWLTPAP